MHSNQTTTIKREMHKFPHIQTYNCLSLFNSINLHVMDYLNLKFLLEIFANVYTNINGPFYFKKVARKKTSKMLSILSEFLIKLKN